MDITILGQALLVVAVLVLFFLLGRVLVLWYFKLDKIENLLKEISENTRKK